jgi:nucleoside-diphosphate-sugar epimerase
MKVLVTGVTGFLGKWIVRALRENGHEPVLFTRRPVQCHDFDGLEQIPGDILDLKTCVEALKGRQIDAIIHPAARPTPTDTRGTDSFNDYAACGLTMQTNIMGLYNMLQAALRNNIGIFVQTGSNCATGHSFRISGTPLPISYLPIDEAHPVDVEDSYSYSKYAGELLLDSYARAYGLRCYAVRSGWILDADMRRQNARHFMEPVQSLESVFNPYVAAEDVASAHVLIMEKAAQSALPPFSAYYCHADDTVASEPSMEILAKFRPDLLRRLKAALPGYAPFMSNQKLKDQTGWRPLYSWRNE